MATNILYIFIIVFSVAISCGVLALWHVFLIFKGMTTVEFFYSQSRSLYDMGIRRNVENALGNPGFLGINWLNPFVRKEEWNLSSKKEDEEII